MNFEQSLLNFADAVMRDVPSFVLVFFRVAGVMIFAPLFGSARVPKRVKGMTTVLITLAIASGMKTTAKVPDDLYTLAIGISGELLFGLAMGTIVSMVFIAGQWAGEMVGQQMGLSMSQVFDPQFAGASSLIGDLYFMLTLVVFISINGHLALLRGMRASFDVIPLLGTRIDQSVVDLLAGLCGGATVMALQLAAPVLLTMIVVDLILGLIGRSMPQLNIMTAGMSIRAIVGLLLLVVGMSLTARIITGSLQRALDDIELRYSVKPAM